ASELSESERGFAALLQELDAYRARIQELLSTIDRLLAAPPVEGWPETRKLETSRDQLQRYLSALASARANRSVCAPRPALDVPDLALLEERARQSSNDGRATRALVDLVRLQEAVLRLRKSERRAEAARSVAIGMATMMDVADAGIQE